MRRALKDRLASYKIPQEMKVLEAIPRNAMGKGELLPPGIVGVCWVGDFVLLTLNSEQKSARERGIWCLR